MDEHADPAPQLSAGERILETRPYEDNAGLVSDGNSRWERSGNTLFFIVNESYVARIDEPA